MLNNKESDVPELHGPHRPLVLYMDSTQESTAVREALERSNVEFQAVFASGRVEPLPTIETPSGTVRGYQNICRYLLPDAKMTRIG